ncbi:exodeoxyribonuclease I [Marinicella sp. W31]|uniref:exodeoxyribonuclease I n=1 Tax=Marinicella sp. W31 TaxID=3023713 RepID=UPI003756CD5B
MGTFYWYDLETFGIDARYDRIAQFAGMRTDEALNPVAEPDMFFCQPVFDYLPDPSSCLVTGITPQQAQQEGVSEVEFSRRVHDIFSLSGSCVAGYNSIRFDDEFVRSLLYRNFYDPYRREYANGNSRWDLIDLVRGCYALRPEGIEWPLREDGYPSFKLEDLTTANNLTHTAAHDALSDVEATIQMARLIREHQPKLFDFYFQLRQKARVKTMVDADNMKPFVHVSGMIPAARGCLSLMVPLAQHPRNNNAVICYDLAFSPQALIELDVEEARELVYTADADLPEGMERIHLKGIHLNKSPFVAPLSVLKGVDLERIGCDYARCQKHLKQLQEAADLVSMKSRAIFDQAYASDNDDVDGMIYDGFFSPQDRQQLDQVRGMDAEALGDLPFTFTDQRADELIWRYRARHFSDNLSNTEQLQWLQQCQQRLNVKFGVDFEYWFTLLEQLRSEHSSEEAARVLDDCEQFVLDKSFDF